MEMYYKYKMIESSICTQAADKKFSLSFTSAATIVLVMLVIVSVSVGNVLAFSTQSDASKPTGPSNIVLESPGLYQSVQKLNNLHELTSIEQWNELLQTIQVQPISNFPEKTHVHAGIAFEARIYEMGGFLLADMDNYPAAAAFLGKAYDMYREAGYKHVLGDLLLALSTLHARHGADEAFKAAQYNYYLWRVSMEFAPQGAQEPLATRTIWPYPTMFHQASTYSHNSDKQAALFAPGMLYMSLIAFISIIIVGLIRSNRSHDKVKPGSLQFYPVSLNFRKMLNALGSGKPAAHADSEVATVEENSAEAADYFSNDRIATLFEQIKLAIQEEKLYTNKNLSISYLAAHLNTNDRYISQAINTHSQHNFSGFVNRYRVKAACDLFEKNESLSIHQMASRCGFGSMSSFHRIFKEIMCVTPCQYQKSVYMKRLRQKTDNE